VLKAQLVALADANGVRKAAQPQTSMLICLVLTSDTQQSF